MDEDIEQLRREMARRQVELQVAVERLRTAARRSVRAREWIRRKPLSWAGGAFLAGWWLGRR